MNRFITIGYKKDGKAEVICPPKVPCQKQKALFREHTGKGFVLIELWSRENGLIKKRRITPDTKKQKAELPKVEIPIAEPEPEIEITPEIEPEKVEVPAVVENAEISTPEITQYPETTNLEETENNEQ